MAQQFLRPHCLDWARVEVQRGPMLFGLTLRPLRFARAFVAAPRETRALLRCVTALMCLCTLSPDLAQAQRPSAAVQTPPAIVPDVTDTPLETALVMIDRAGLARGRIVDRPSSGRPGIVLDQSIRPGTRVPRDTPLHLGVAQAPLAIVPDVTGRPLETAQVMIDKAQLARGRIVDRPSDGQPGIVLEQSLRPGTRVPRNTPMHLGVAQEQLVIVPDVTGRPLETAQVMIDKAQLARGRVVDRPSDGPSGLVLSQSLKPGARVPRGTALDLTVSQVPLVTVPNVMQRPIGDALAQIDKEGLARGRVVDRPADGPSGLVLSQSLKPGARVPRGTALDLTVSQVPLVTVPDLMKLPVGDALTRIDGAGLARGTVTNRPSPGPPDRVIAQSPLPRTQVPQGTTLNLTVSQAPPATPPDAQPPDVPIPPAGDPSTPPTGPVSLLVPDVVGQNVAEATALVGRAGLTIGTVTERSFLLPPYFQPAGTVFQQQPAARTPLAAPVPVDLVVLPRIPAWAIVIPSALLGAALVLLLRRRPPPLRVNPPPQPQVPLPTVLTRAHADPGDQRMPTAMNPVSLEIRVRHTADRGSQSVREVPPPSGRAAFDSPPGHN
jgi:beta-lactam-binding protein with PASTA domain